MSITPGEWITIAAILAGPIFAVVTQLTWQRWKERRDQKRWILSTLMSLRAMPLHTDYVRALNMIDVSFYKNDEVRRRWKEAFRPLWFGGLQRGPYSTGHIGQSPRPC